MYVLDALLVELGELQRQGYGHLPVAIEIEGDGFGVTASWISKIMPARENEVACVLLSGHETDDE